jgi:molybdate transport system substrate-binding protein
MRTPSLFACAALAAIAGAAAVACSKEPTGGEARANGEGKTVDGKLTGEIKVAGASDLVFAMEELGPRFTKETGVKVVFIPGSSGQLAAKIQQGAPFDVFLSANMDFVVAATKDGSCLEDTRALYAYGRLVMWSREADPPPPATLEGLADPRFAKIAIAQPEHAPYGAAARAAMHKVGVWDAVSSRVVYGSNVKDTMQMAETGNADVAIVALALVKKGGGHAVEIPAELHPEIAQGMAVCKSQNGPAARAFVSFMASPSTRELLRSYGFGVPE